MASRMFFAVVSSLVDVLRRVNKNVVYLVDNDWDDWFTYATTYGLYYYDNQSIRHDIGSVKIGEFNMKDGQRRARVPESFNSIPARFFSLGQSDDYYENLNMLGDALRDRILNGLNDVAKKETTFAAALKESVTRVSLLRFVTPTSVRGQFRRLATGGAKLSEYDFEYSSPRGSATNANTVKLTFEVNPESNPPTNIHVIIGRNGVGKTHLLNNMINSILSGGTRYGKFSSKKFAAEDLFANLVSVTFSAFDDSEPPPERKDKSQGIRYSYIGLKRAKVSPKFNPAPKSPTTLTNEFVKSLGALISQSKLPRWKRAMEMLEGDPIFKSSEISETTDIENEEEFKTAAFAIFKRLSSGHKIVLLTITRLIETVEERSLVLIDEPEAHLHPPLLSAFVRSLSDLITNRNAVAIIATHSPVILQEVPKRCVWRLMRMGLEASAQRLEIESFGENIGALTREVFGLEVTRSGFHDMLSQALEKFNNYEDILSYFNNELGQEARALIRTLLYLKNADNE